MPAKTASQYGAMQAAAHGKGRLGISKMVAKKFIEHTPRSARSKYARILGKRRRKTPFSQRIGERGGS